MTAQLTVSEHNNDDAYFYDGRNKISINSDSKLSHHVKNAICQTSATSWYFGMLLILVSS